MHVYKTYDRDCLGLCDCFKKYAHIFVCCLASLILGLNMTQA